MTFILSSVWGYISCTVYVRRKISLRGEKKSVEFVSQHESQVFEMLGLCPLVFF